MGALILCAVWLISLANKQTFQRTPARLDSNVEAIWAVQNIYISSVKWLDPGIFQNLNFFEFCTCTVCYLTFPAGPGKNHPIIKPVNFLQQSIWTFNHIEWEKYRIQIASQDRFCCQISYFKKSYGLKISELRFREMWTSFPTSQPPVRCVQPSSNRWHSHEFPLHF